MKFIQIPQEHYNVSRLEDYCYMLRNAMIDMSLKFPYISTFERYLNEITKEESIIYIVDLLHECWCFAHPYYLFNKGQKDDNILTFLTKYRRGELRNGMGVIKEELDKKISPLLIAYHKVYQNAGKMTQCYGDYMDDLYNVVRIHCNRLNIVLKDDFTIIYTIETDKSPEQLKKVFQVFSSQFNCCENNDSNLQVFISMFSTAISVREGTILWTDIGSSKGKEPSLASIDTVFRSLGIEMNSHNKNIICKYITWANGSITPEQIKPRKNDKQEKLKEAILQSLI